MFDRRIRPFIDPPMEALARLLVACGIGADLVTVAAFTLGTAACASLFFNYYGLALALILLSRLLDGLDGCVARASPGGAQDRGAYLDIVLDFIFYAGVVFFFALGRPETALAAAFVIFSFVGTGTSFLACAIIDAKRGTVTEKKSFSYAAGLCEGAETILFLVLICLLPVHFMLIALAFGTLCWVTTAARIAGAVRHYS